MVHGLIKLVSGDVMLVTGLKPENFAKFSGNAPEPAAVDLVVVCVASTREELTDAIRTAGIVPAGTEIQPVDRKVPPAKTALQPAAPSTPTPSTGKGKSKKAKKAKKRR